MLFWKVKGGPPAVWQSNKPSFLSHEEATLGKWTFGNDCLGVHHSISHLRRRQKFALFRESKGHARKLKWCTICTCMPVHSNRILVNFKRGDILLEILQILQNFNNLALISYITEWNHLALTILKMLQKFCAHISFWLFERFPRSSQSPESRELLSHFSDLFTNYKENFTTQWALLSVMMDRKHVDSSGFSLHWPISTWTNIPDFRWANFRRKISYLRWSAGSGDSQPSILWSITRAAFSHNYYH